MRHLRSAQLLLLLLSCLAFYSTWCLFIINGSADIIHIIKAFKQLPTNSSPQELLTKYTGIGLLDAHIQTLVIFFASVLSNPSADLQVRHFACQVFVAWSLLLLESLRLANKGKGIAWLGLWGLLVQNATLAVASPIYFIVYLAQSSPEKTLIRRVQFPSISDLLSAGIAMIVGYVLPTHLMARDPKSVGWLWKQRYIAVWQLFPIWVSLAQQASAAVFNKLLPKSCSTSRIRIMRAAYGTLLALSILASLQVMKDVAMAHFAPERLPEELRNYCSYHNVFVPDDWRGKPVHDLAQGAKLLLVYDELFTGLAFRVWALAVYSSIPDRHKMSLKWPKSTLFATACLFVWLPTGFAVAVLWLRDELIGNGQEDKKVT